MHYLETSVQADATTTLCAHPTCPASSTPCAPNAPKIRSFSFIRLTSQAFILLIQLLTHALKVSVRQPSLISSTKPLRNPNIRILFQRGVKPLLPSQWVTSVVMFMGNPGVPSNSRWGWFSSKGAVTARSLGPQLTSVQRNPVPEASPGLLPQAFILDYLFPPHLFLSGREIEINGDHTPVPKNPLWHLQASLHNLKGKKKKNQPPSKSKTLNQNTKKKPCYF